MVRDFHPYDDETGIEAYPDFLALEGHEGDLFTGANTKELYNFWKETWSAYNATLADEYLERDLVVHLAGGPTRIHVEPGGKLALVLDQLPTFDVYLDHDDAGLASGTGYVIFIADKASMEEVNSTIEALADAIRRDHKAVLDQIRSEPGGLL